jgi:hypothetical protein
MKKAKSFRAYHFVGAMLRDGRPIPPDGEWIDYVGPYTPEGTALVMCKSGLHASRHPFDALRYAPGSTLCLVEISGAFIEQDDKVCARKRRIIKRIDAENLLWDFARWCALSVIHLWEAPPIVREYLETGDALKRSAARHAAWSAAWSAAESAAESAARYAARYAAWSAAESAAWSAAWSAAESAAESAARHAARHAAWSAAESAAESVARIAKRKQFKKMVMTAFRERVR